MNGIIQAVQEPEVTLTSNTASLPFAVVDLRTRCAINCVGFMNHNEGSPIFSILQNGYYEISFNGNITSATAGDVALGLFANGTLIPGTEMDATVTTAGDFENISFNKKIRVCGNGNVDLSINSLPTVTYSGGANPTITDTQIAIVKNANISIERLA